MCGIAGIIDPHGFEASKLRTMANAIKHRGPDDEGFVLFSNAKDSAQLKGSDTISAFSELEEIADQKATIGLAHRRLSILDLSENGHQPMVDPSTENVIVHNGEIYNYKELVSELQLVGYEFKSGSDTEMILKAYAEWGPDCVQRFIGMWAFAIWDPSGGRAGGGELFCSRDRFGIKPFYYVEGERFAFASEIKALLRAGLAEPKVKAQDIVQYLVHGALKEPYTNLFSDVHELPPGHNMLVNAAGQTRIEQYYEVGKTASDTGYRQVFEQAIDLHLVSDVPVGACLSGGLDSSSIVTLADTKNDTSFHTFTAAFDDKDTDESHFAAMVREQHTNIEGHECRPTAEGFLQDIDRLMEIQELPIGSSSIYAQWKVMESAAQAGIKVLLDGQGADEVLGGYYNFAGLRVIELLRSFRFVAAFKERKTLKANFDPNIDKSIARAFFHFLPAFLQRMIRKQHRLGSTLITSKYAPLIAKTGTPERGAKNFRQLSINSLKYNLHELLRYEDRNSMAFSIESRVPFLDHRLVELTLGLSTDQKIKGGWTKKVLRKAMEADLPEAIVWRKDKKGFVTPQGKWMEQIRGHMIEKVKSMPEIPIIDRSKLIDQLETPQTNAARLSELFRVYSLVRWMEIYQVELF